MHAITAEAQKLSIGLVPKRARPILEEDAKYWAGPIAADARGTLAMLDSGEYEPD
jgi:hypothetical protein